MRALPQLGAKHHLRRVVCCLRRPPGNLGPRGRGGRWQERRVAGRLWASAHARRQLQRRLKHHARRGQDRDGTRAHPALEASQHSRAGVEWARMRLSRGTWRGGGCHWLRDAQWLGTFEGRGASYRHEGGTAEEGGVRSAFRTTMAGSALGRVCSAALRLVGRARQLRNHLLGAQKHAPVWRDELRAGRIRER